MTKHVITANQGTLNTGTGDSTFEASGVVINGGIDMRYQSDDKTGNGGGNQIVFINGGVFGSIDDYAGATSGNDQINISSTGYVQIDWFGAINLGGGGHTIINNGTISATNYGGAIEITGGVGANQAAIDTITNTGTITASDMVGRSGDGVIQVGCSLISIANSGSILAGGGAIGMYINASVNAAIDNSGLITGGLSIQGAASTILNTGRIVGTINLSSSSAVLDSSNGQLAGPVVTSGNSSRVVAGTTGGKVTGGLGNDIFIANQSQTAANNAAQFTLDGGTGTNALYGGGAFNTFVAGDANGGRNQIHGGLSKMSDVLGYHNNTLDFSATPSNRSVYVDLLNGHNAYLYATSNHSGALTLDDSIVNVPNVIGSAGGDLIRADNTGDSIQAGAGADVLYAGTGADTFVYKGYADSNTVSGYDTVAGFQTGSDKLDLSAFNTDASHIAILSSSASTVFYLEQTPGTFHSATDLAISFQGANAIKASDVIL